MSDDTFELSEKFKTVEKFVESITYISGYHFTVFPENLSSFEGVRLRTSFTLRRRETVDEHFISFTELFNANDGKLRTEALVVRIKSSIAALCWTTVDNFLSYEGIET